MLLKKTLVSLLLILAIISQVHYVMGQTRFQKDKEAITAVSKARALAFNQGNAEGIARHFTEDAVLMAPGKPTLIGTEAVRAYYQSIFDEFEVELKSYYVEVEVSKDMAYGRGEAIVNLKPRNGGKPSVASSKYLNILSRQPDGSWKTTHDIWNSNDELP